MPKKEFSIHVQAKLDGKVIEKLDYTISNFPEWGIIFKEMEDVLEYPTVDDCDDFDRD